MVDPVDRPEHDEQREDLDRRMEAVNESAAVDVEIDWHALSLTLSQVSEREFGKPFDEFFGPERDGPEAAGERGDFGRPERRRPQQLVLREEFADTPIEQHRAPAHQHDPPRILGDEPRRMRNYHDCDTAAVELAHQRHHSVLLAIIEAGRGLVENEKTRAQREYASDREPLTFTFAQQERIAVSRTGKIDGFEDFGASTLDFGVIESEVARTESDFILDRGGEDLMVGILEHVADFLRGLGRP